MEELFAISIVLIAFGVIVVLPCVACWALVRLVTGGGRGQAPRAEESKMTQEIYLGLLKMEQRVETLETLLLERDGKERKS